MFVILQKYDFSSKSQLYHTYARAEHDVCDTAKVRFFKQITTLYWFLLLIRWMFVILQKYDFSSKSQQIHVQNVTLQWCLWYCKSTIFQANHNTTAESLKRRLDVCDTAKVRFFKQITTCYSMCLGIILMFVILQKYDFSSKSQQGTSSMSYMARCLWYCKSTIFQANHNIIEYQQFCLTDVCDTAKVRFFKQITTPPL